LYVVLSMTLLAPIALSTMLYDTWVFAYGFFLRRLSSLLLLLRMNYYIYTFMFFFFWWLFSFVSYFWEIVSSAFMITATKEQVQIII
jgi:hypothetical protein